MFAMNLLSQVLFDLILSNQTISSSNSWRSGKSLPDNNMFSHPRATLRNKNSRSGKTNREHQLPSIGLFLLVGKTMAATVSRSSFSKLEAWIFSARTEPEQPENFWRRIRISPAKAPERKSACGHFMAFPDRAGLSSDRLFISPKPSDLHIPAPWHNVDDINRAASEPASLLQSDTENQTENNAGEKPNRRGERPARCSVFEWLHHCWRAGVRRHYVRQGHHFFQKATKVQSFFFLVKCHLSLCSVSLGDFTQVQIHVPDSWSRRFLSYYKMILDQVERESVLKKMHAERLMQWWPAVKSYALIMVVCVA